MKTFAEIAVDSYQDPTKKLFTYEVPENFAAKVGQKVTVPFGKRTVEGYIWVLSSKKPAFPTKEIKEVKGQGFTEEQVKLARWMSEYYLASPLDCLKCQIQGKGERATFGSQKDINTLLLIPYAGQVWLRAHTLQDKSILVGSRSTVFAQLPNLKRIIIEEPENWNYKDERSPYYHVKDVAQKRAEIEGLELEPRYQIPRVEDLYVEKLEAPKLKPAKIIDLNSEKAAGNFTFISQNLEKYVKSNLNTIVYVSSKELREKMKEELRKIGADENKIAVLGPELLAMAGKTAQAVFWTDVDTIFNLPDFRAHEKIVWTAQKLGNLASQALYLQTSSPDHPLFAELGTGDLGRFYQRELEARRELSFPPASQLIKFAYTSKSSAKTNFEAEKLYEKLQAISHLPLAVSPPYQPYAPTPGKFQLNISIKMKKSTPSAKLLALVSPDWKIEVDPESLL